MTTSRKEEKLYFVDGVGDNDTGGMAPSIQGALTDLETDVDDNYHEPGQVFVLYEVRRVGLVDVRAKVSFTPDPLPAKKKAPKKRKK